ncbi:MAG: hypothetical protein CVU63_25540 [Deltaproteobacteria bacterium HGW-Deltaproteobacteria-20]|jgi:hypothetical protein|nr:MAG: hypothetical protein CVU63_25540 [Deltaproteobacteria bacterium HGW-Deltaproteobacteria-20]
MAREPFEHNDRSDAAVPNARGHGLRSKHRYPLEFDAGVALQTSKLLASTFASYDEDREFT